MNGSRMIESSPNKSISLFVIFVSGVITKHITKSGSIDYK